MVTIPEANTTAGIQLEEVKETPQKFLLVIPEDKQDCVEEKEREREDGKGKFMQYMLHLKDSEEEPRVLMYLFARHLQDCRTVFGDDSTKWDGRYIEVSATTNKKGYLDPVVKPVEG